MNIWLYIAAFLIIVIGIAHSYLGERYILMRLFRQSDLPKLLGSTELTRQTLRFAWHVTSIAWFGLAAVLLALTQPTLNTSELGLIVGCTFLAHFLIALLGSRGRHLSWPVFLAIGISSIYATSH